jgi:hypothetical protein
MDWQERLRAFAILEGGWITWLVMGFALGGAALLIQRACALLAARGGARDRGRRRGVQMTGRELASC